MENPLELLKEEMEHDEISIRVNAIHRVPVVAALFPLEGVKSQLLPYIERRRHSIG